jgi:hypothetical protein
LITLTQTMPDAHADGALTLLTHSRSKQLAVQCYTVPPLAPPSIPLGYVLFTACMCTLHTITELATQANSAANCIVIFASRSGTILFFFLLPFYVNFWVV